MLNLIYSRLSSLTDLLSNACWIAGGGTAADGGAVGTADWGVDTLGGTWPALCGASNGVVLCACCNPPE